MLTTEASLFGIGAIFSGGQLWGERFIPYASATLSKNRRNLKLHCDKNGFFFAKVCFTQQFRNYLRKQTFLIVTNFMVLTWLHSFKEPDGLLARWIEKLGEFDFENKHEAGKIVPSSDCLWKVAETEKEVKDCNQVIQMNMSERQKYLVPWFMEISGTTSWTSEKGSRTYYTEKLDCAGNALKKSLAGASRVDFRNLRIENTLYKRNKPFDNFKNLWQKVIQRSLLNEILPLFHEHCGHLVWRGHMIELENASTGPGWEKKFTSCKALANYAFKRSRHTRNTYTDWQVGNLETKSSLLANCLRHYGTFTRFMWKKTHSVYCRSV